MLAPTLALALAVAPAPIDNTAPSDPAPSVEPADAPTTDAPEEQPTPGDDPAASVPSDGQPVQGDEQPETPPEPSNAPDPFAPERVEGFPATVDLRDESTWSDLTVQQKDELRAIRASRDAAAAEGRPVPPRAIEHEKPPGFDSAAMERTSRRLGAVNRRRGSEALDWYDEREARLVRLTVGFGVTWGVSLIVTGALAAYARSLGTDCAAEVSDSVIDPAPPGSICNDEAKKAKRLMIPVWIFGIAGSVSGIGTLISGGYLGGHRGSRPYLGASVGRRQAGVNLGGRF